MPMSITRRLSRAASSVGMLAAVLALYAGFEAAAGCLILAGYLRRADQPSGCRAGGCPGG